MSSQTLSFDPRRPRAGDWPSPDELDPADRVGLALLGIPTWRTSLSPTGAGQTPAAVRAALRHYSSYTPAGTAAEGTALADTVSADIGPAFSGQTFVDFGDVAEPDCPSGEARALALMADAAVLATVVVALGGDNALTVPAALGAWGQELNTAGLITLDAQHDLRDGMSNGSPVRRLVEAGLDGRRIVQIGIAGCADSAEYAARARDFGITVVYRDELQRRPIEDVLVEAFEIVGSAGGPIHVDLDVDVCDRSTAPGCPASVPGGISAHELRVAARSAGAHPAVRSVDIAEVDSTSDSPDGRTVRLAALCVLEVAAGLRERNGE